VAASVRGARRSTAARTGARNPERIVSDLNRDTVSIRRVNPLDFDSGDRIHALGGSTQAIPTDRDLVQATGRKWRSTSPMYG
jgi:hypothetical protein